MIFYLTAYPGKVQVQASVVARGIMGDFNRIIKPGEKFAKIDYADLREIAEEKGKIDIE